MDTVPADRFGRAMRDLRISVTDRCNLRCSYCMPADVFGPGYKFLPKQQITTFEEVERIARVAASLGVRKLRLTGGEPLLRSELPRLVERLARIAGIEEFGLTTNGTLLAGFAQALKQAGLNRVTVSLDSLDEEIFRRMNGRRSGLAPVLAGIEAAERAGLSPIKLNCVVRRGVNDQTMLDLARYFRGRGPIVRFIEFMDVGNVNGWNMTEVVGAREIVERIGEEFPLEPLEPNYAGEVARRYRYADGEGEIGVIASVTQPFCGGCTRARLSPEGKLVTCLFASGGTDLLGPMRSGLSDEGLRDLMADVWRTRTDRYSEDRTRNTQHRDRKIEMHRIGG